MTRSKGPPPFIVRWREALRRDSGLPQPVRHLGHVMSDYADTHTGKNVCPGSERLAEEMGLKNVRHVGKYREALVAAGFAVEVRKGGSPKGGKRESSVFALTIPNGTTDSQSPVEVPTTDSESPVPLTLSRPTPDSESRYRFNTGPLPTPAAARAAGPPLAAAGPDAALAASLADVFGWDVDRLTKTEGRDLARATTELSDIEATAETVRLTARAYRRRFPNAPLTVRALLKHWSTLNADEPEKPDDADRDDEKPPPRHPWQLVPPSDRNRICLFWDCTPAEAARRVETLAPEAITALKDAAMKKVVEEKAEVERQAAEKKAEHESEREAGLAVIARRREERRAARAAGGDVSEEEGLL